MINLGPLDRSGVLYTNTPAQGLGAAVVLTKTKVCDLFLTQVNIPIKTRMAADRESEMADAVFLSRWFDGLANAMLLDVEGHSYRVTRREEMGRREGWKIYCTETA